MSKYVIHAKLALVPASSSLPVPCAFTRSMALCMNAILQHTPSCNAPQKISGHFPGRLTPRKTTRAGRTHDTRNDVLKFISLSHTVNKNNQPDPRHDDLPEVPPSRPSSSTFVCPKNQEEQTLPFQVFSRANRYPFNTCYNAYPTGAHWLWRP